MRKEEEKGKCGESPQYKPPDITFLVWPCYLLLLYFLVETNTIIFPM